MRDICEIVAFQIKLKFGDFFGSDFDKFFSKVENGINNEIVASPNYNIVNKDYENGLESRQENYD